MFFLQGLLVGLASLAPIGIQNLFIINTALVQPLRRIILTFLIVTFFDISLSLSAFFGMGALIAASPLFKLIILICGSLLILYIAYTIMSSSPTIKTVDTNIPIKQIITTAFIVTWMNPQALIDASLMFGAFRATLPPLAADEFISGIALASPLWFGSLAYTIRLIAKKIKISSFIWINRICGLIILGYGIKLLINGIQLFYAMYLG